MIKIIKAINRSAKWAIDGITDTFKEEFMMRVQFSFGAIQFILALLVHAPKIEVLFILWMWITIVAMELMNTGVENVTNLAAQKKYHNHGRRAKDSAGGAVFLLSISSWVVTILLIGDDLLQIFL